MLISCGASEEATNEGIKWAFEPFAEVCLGIIAPFSNGHTLGCLGTLAYGTVAAPFAAIVSAARIRPVSEAEPAERSLSFLAGFKAINPCEALRDQIVLVGQSETGFVIRALDDTRQGALQSGPTKFDSIMILESFDFSLRFDKDKIIPTITLQMEVTASLERAPDWTPLHWQVWRYWSEEEDFFDLTDDGAKHLEAVIAKGYERLARKIVHDIFVASVPETQSPEQPGTVWTVDASTLCCWSP